MTDETLPVGLDHHRAGRLAAAEDIYRAALRRNPRNADAWHLLGLLAHDCGHSERGIDLIRRAIEINPRAAVFHSNLGALLGAVGNQEASAQSLRAAIQLAPADAELHNDLGACLAQLGRDDEALAAHREAVRLAPRRPQAHCRLGDALRDAGELALATAAYRQALAIDPEHAEAWVGLGVVHEVQGETPELINCYRRAAQARDPAAASRAHSSLLLALHYTSGDEPRQLFEEHLAWAERHAAPLYAPEPHFENDRTSDRPLRVGYLSPDFRAHPVGTFIEPVLGAHDRKVCVPICYSAVTRPDAMTARLCAAAGGWREVVRLKDDQLCALIRQDRIDVLVDLTGHSIGGRPLVFARRAAPVQIAYLGYCDTTGLDTMDWRITDAWHDPPGSSEAYHTERLYRVDGCAWCYRPHDVAPPVNELPALTGKGVTFAALNRTVKITSDMLRLWSQILRAVPGSSLMLVLERGQDEALARARAAEAGISDAALRFTRRGSLDGYLRLYHSADIALDTFPHNGHTTTCDALWMGVPTITLAGRTFVSRMGVSVLSAVGLEECIATTPEEYVAIAARLAADLPALAALRQTLRKRVLDSPLRDAPRLAPELEKAFQHAWQAWGGGVQSD